MKWSVLILTAFSLGFAAACFNSSGEKDLTSGQIDQSSGNNNPSPVKNGIATCYGYSPCNACKSCNYCKWCRSGGTCGICKELIKPAPKKYNSPSTPSTPSGQCKAKTKKGTRCSRSARSGGYCWQHGG